MKSPTLEYINWLYGLVGLALEKSASRKEKFISNLKNWILYIEILLYAVLTLGFLITNRDSLPIHVQYYLVLQIIGTASITGVYVGSAPYKYQIHDLLKYIDATCEERKNEFTSQIYSRTERIVVTLHKYVFTTTLAFSVSSYVVLSVLTAVGLYFSDDEFESEKLYHANNLLYSFLLFSF